MGKGVVSNELDRLRKANESEVDFIKRLKTSHDFSCSENSSLLNALQILILVSAALMAFMNRLYSVIQFESIIHEFDPWFNFRSTKFFVEHGFYEFLNWLDETAWYPLGRIVGTTVYPGLMYTSGFIYYILHKMCLPVSIKDICVFVAPVFSSLSVFATYAFTKEIWNSRAALISSIFISIAPGYISRSVAGSYDNEAIAIFALIFTFYLWLKCLGTGSVYWAIATALSYWFMVAAWGGYVFIINMIPLHVFVLLLMGRYSQNMYKSYCTFYVLGVILAMQIPFVGTVSVTTSEHLASLGVFGLLQLIAFTEYVKSLLPKKEYQIFTKYIVSSLIVLGISVLLLLGVTGVISPLTGRFYSLFDTSYAAIHIPIITSVAEHQPTGWTSFFMDLHFLPVAMMVGVYICIDLYTDARVFAVLYALFASYFAGVMVRLMLTLTPIVCVLGGIAISYAFDNLIRIEKAVSVPIDVEKKPHGEAAKKVPRAKSAPRPIIGTIGLVILATICSHFIVHSVWVTMSHYSSPSVVLSYMDSSGAPIVIDDFREAYYWLNRNTAPDAKVMSWWDYGYQIAGFSNRTTIVDNNTWNHTHIATVGLAMASNETVAYQIFRQLDIDYVLIIFGGLLGYSGDDINKFLWMVRIGQGEFPQKIREHNYISKQGYTTGKDVTKTMKESVMFKTSYYNFDKINTGYGGAIMDRARNIEITARNIKLETLEEAFTSKNWLVRIYKVKDLENRAVYGKKQIRV